MKRVVALAALIAASAACTCGEPVDDLAPLEVAEGCQPLLTGFDCFMPYPSDFYRVEDAAQPSGHRIQTRGAARLVTAKNANADVTTDHPIDGFSRSPYLVAAFPHDISAEGFVGLFDPPEDSLKSSSNTLLVEVETGTPVAHFVDLDPRAKDPKRRAIVIHPLVRLKEKARYAVAIHNVKQADGSAVPAPEGFRRLRDDVGRSDPALAPLRDRYASLFVAVEKAGVPRGQLQLAWDFTTGSDEQVERDMLRVRELTLQWLATNTPQVTISETKENSATDVWRLVRGTVTMPLFTTDVLPGSLLHRGADGQVAQNGTATFPFVAQVPVSVRDQFAPGRALTYGHGFFGSTGEAEGSSARRIANRMGAVMFATEWWGMQTADVGKVADALTSKPFKTFDSFDRVHQAVANWIVLTDAIERVFHTLPEFKRPMAAGPGVSDDGMGNSNAGHATYEGGAGAYIGISQGHILGGTMAALNPYLTRPVLQVGGSGFTHMMFRARPFIGYLGLLELSIPDPLEQQKWVSTLQRHFDKFDPGTYARYLVQEPLPGTPAGRRVLMQMGDSDTSVPNIGTHLHVRAAGIPQLEDGSAPIWGVPRVPSPVEGSAVVTYDFGHDVAQVNAVAIPPDPENEVHEGVRKLDAALNQMRTFYDEGRIIHTCDAACDPQ